MFGLTAMHKLAAWNYPTMMTLLVKKAAGDESKLCPQDKDGNTPLHHAATMSSTQSLQYLLRIYSDTMINLKNKQGQTAKQVSPSSVTLQFL